MRLWAVLAAVAALGVGSAAQSRQTANQQRGNAIEAEPATQQAQPRPRRESEQGGRADQPGNQSANASSSVGLELDRRSAEAAERQANEAARANGWAAKSYILGVVQGMAAIFGVIFTAIAAAAAIAAAIYARRAAHAAAQSATADNASLTATLKAAEDGRADAREQAKRFKEQMSLTDQIMQRITDTAYAMKDSARAQKINADAARKELRAYAFMNSATIHDFEIGKTPMVEVVIANSGRTPAHDVVMWMAARSLRTGAVKFDRPEDTSGFSRGPIPPGGDKPMTIHWDSPVREGEAMEFARGERAIYVFGEVTYTDVFGEKHHTRFRLCHEHTRRVGAFGTMAEGNDAD
jgi:hypothetical protein